MKFKIVVNDEIHVIRKEISKLNQLISMIANRFPLKNTQAMKFYYQDEDGDLIRILCEEDLQVLLNESKQARSIKIFVKEDLSQTIPLSTKDEEESSDGFMILSERDVCNEKVIGRFRTLARKLVLKRMVC